MPFMGIGIHILIALFFAVHAMRNGREMYWLMILFAFPLLGSVVYFFAVFLPDHRLHNGIRRVTDAAVRTLDPGKELRDAEQAFDMTPTAQNQMRVADAFLNAGDAAQAAHHYEACLKGPFANDPHMRFGAGKARVLNGQGAAAIELLESIRKQNPDFRTEQLSLALAQAYALEGKYQFARTEFISAITRFGSLEARTEYIIWALGIGDADAAQEHYREVERSMKHWNKNTRSFHKPLLKRLDAAFAAANKT